MSRRLHLVPDIKALVGDLFNQITAEKVISGELIHNVETDRLCPADSATLEFKTEAVAAYKRFLIAREGR